MNELFSIAGKVAVITGAGGVLGGNIAQHFVQQGAKVVAIDIRQEQLDNRVAELKQYGNDVIGIIGNVLDISNLEKVAEEIVAAQGPVIVNDISGGTMDDGMFDYVARTGVPYIMMHIQGTPQTMQKNPHYEDIVKEVRKFLTDRIACLNAKGFDNIILDPGFGFGKTLAHNYELMNGLEHFQDLDYPLLVGISRKSMIYKLLDNSPAEALNGTAVLNTISLLKGANILRVHDVREACEAVKIFRALSGGEIDR
mgnify:CR=1 FL=1